MKWYTALTIGFIACALAYFINMELEQRTKETTRLQQEINQLKEQTEANRKEIAVNNEIVKKLINEEW